MRTPPLAVLLAIPVALACTSEASTSEASTSEASKTKASSAPESPHEAFFRRPDRVQIFLADHRQYWGGMQRDLPPGVTLDDLPHSGGGYVFPVEGPELNEAQRQKLAATFRPASEPNPFPPRKCMFNPDIALRYWRGNTSMDVIICLGCIKFVFFAANETYVPDEQVGFLEDYQYLQQLAQESFPKENFRFYPAR